MVIMALISVYRNRFIVHMYKANFIYYSVHIYLKKTLALNRFYLSSLHNVQCQSKKLLNTFPLQISLEISPSVKMDWTVRQIPNSLEKLHKAWMYCILIVYCKYWWWCELRVTRGRDLRAIKVQQMLTLSGYMQKHWRVTTFPFAARSQSKQSTSDCFEYLGLLSGC